MDKANRPHIFCHMETSLDGKIMVSTFGLKKPTPKKIPSIPYLPALKRILSLRLS